MVSTAAWSSKDFTESCSTPTKLSKNVLAAINFKRGLEVFTDKDRKNLKRKSVFELKHS